MTRAQAQAFIEAMKTLRGGAGDQLALNSMAAYPAYENLVERKETVEIGFRFHHNGLMYKTRQASYTFDGQWEPGAVGTESLYERIDIEHAGTLEDPIPYAPPMEIFNGKYYIQNDVIYLCNRDSGTALTHPLRDLINIYVTVIA